MSRTYKYPRESLDDSIVRNEPKASLEIKKRLEKQKQSRKRKIKIARSFKQMIRFRDQQRSRM